MVYQYPGKRIIYTFTIDGLYHSKSHFYRELTADKKNSVDFGHYFSVFDIYRRRIRSYKSRAGKCRIRRRARHFFYYMFRILQKKRIVQRAARSPWKHSRSPVFQYFFKSPLSYSVPSNHSIGLFPSNSSAMLSARIFQLINPPFITGSPVKGL